MVSVLDVRICGLPSGTEIWGKDTGLNVGALRPVRPNSELGRVDHAVAQPAKNPEGWDGVA